MQEMEEKLGAILSNPQMMQQIFNLAQSLGQESAPPRQETPPAAPPEFDLGLLSKIAGLAQLGSNDSQQEALLSALSPYLRQDRVAKLEKAMQAAKMARLASAFLNSGGLSLLTGR